MAAHSTAGASTCTPSTPAGDYDLVAGQVTRTADVAWVAAVAAQALAVLRNDHPPDSAVWRASNVTAVELNGVRPEGRRTADLLFVSRLLPWKGAAGDSGVAPPGPPGGRAAELQRGPGRSPPGAGRASLGRRRPGPVRTLGPTRRAAARDRPRGGARPPLLPRRRAAVLRRSAEPGDARGLPGPRRAGRAGAALVGQPRTPGRFRQREGHRPAARGGHRRLPGDPSARAVPPGAVRQLVRRRRAGRLRAGRPPRPRGR